MPKSKWPKLKPVTVKLTPVVIELLTVLGDGSAQQAIFKLIDHAQQGVYRPGSWEREWICQAFGSEWIAKMEPGCPYGRPNGHMFQKPKSAASH